MEDIPLISNTDKNNVVQTERRYVSELNVFVNSQDNDNPILIGGNKIKTRVLYPAEYIKLRNSATLRYKAILDVLLCSGLRYVEAQFVQKNPTTCDLKRKVIHLPAGVEKKKKQVFKQRYIRISDYCLMQLPLFFKGNKLPRKSTWNRNLIRWAKKAGINPVSISSKTTRKTWESWLMFYFPNRQLQILLNQGHTQEVSINHYFLRLK